MAVAKKRSYKKVSCHTSKKQAKSEATKMRSAGKTALVLKSGSGYCIYSAGKRKTATTKKR